VSSIRTRRPICTSSAALPLLPCLVFTQTVRSTVGSIAVPVDMCLCRRTDQLLTAQMSFLLFPVFWQVYSERAVGIGTGSWVTFCEEQRHLLVDTIVFCVHGGGWWVRGRAHGGGVHVGDEIVVVGLLGPEVCARVCLAFGLYYSAVCPEEERAVEERASGAGYGAANGGIAPVIVVG